MTETTQVTDLALSLGFDAVGIASWDAVLDQHVRLEKWLGHGYAGDMAYLERKPAERCNPRSLLPACNSVIVCALNYFQPLALDTADDQPAISRYAWGNDYHDVLRIKLKALGLSISEQLSEHQWKPTVDTSPVLEKAFAEAGGLGWRGKHSLIINPELGSWFFIGLLLTSLKLKPGTPLEDGCQGCKDCLDVCPTGALVAPRVLAANKCISFLTTECKEPTQTGTDLKGWLYGCDLCQTVCPHNASATAAKEPQFAAHGEIPQLTAQNLLEMDQQDFDKTFSRTVIKRRKLWRMQEQAKRLIEADANL